MTKSDKSRERDLFRRLADGTLTAEEFAVVEERLRTDAGFRERYVRAMGIEACLYEAFSFPGTYHLPEPRTGSPLRVFVFGGLCATLLVGVIGWMYWTFAVSRPNAMFIASALTGLKPVAIVTRADPGFDEIRPGLRIRTGVLTIGNGQLQLEFLNGAQLNIEGPAELQILSADAATLIKGKAAARIPPGARGFILNTPDAAIVDLGTEFAVSVSEGGNSEIHVVEGEVDVSLLGTDGNTLTSEKLTEATSLRMSGRPVALERIDTPSVVFPRIQAQTSAPLRVSERYVQSVRASRPDIYWRFDDVVDGRVPNDVGPRWSGTIHVMRDDPAAIVVRDGVARFTPSLKPHHIEPDAPIPGLNREAFSIEFWISPDSFHWATLTAVVPEETAVRNLHMSLIELPYKSSLVYTPGSFRFLHRFPPEEHGGVNLFTNGDCTPGLWHHLVAVKTPIGMKLYLNGRLVRELAETMASDDASYRLLVGQLYEAGARQLAGAIDEYAVYLRELSAEEVQQHYRAMFPDQRLGQD